MKRMLLVILGIIVIAGIVFVTKKSLNSPLGAGSGEITIVAVENFYGDVAKQLGGNHVRVTSILSDPNVDPHEYESNVQDGIAVTNANIVIENGLEYDTWMDKLLSASKNPNRIVLTEGKIVPHPLPDNPHVWYGVDNMPTVARSIVNALKKVDAKDASYFDQNLVTFDNSLTPLNQKIAEIKSKYSGTPVGLTETIYLYQTQPEGLHVLTPLEFERAIAEGNDPAAADVQTTNDQVSKKQIKILIYNSQTVTPITTNLQNTAVNLGIPVASVSETMPQDKHYQSWMMDQLTSLEQSLQKALQ